MVGLVSPIILAGVHALASHTLPPMNNSDSDAPKSAPQNLPPEAEKSKREYHLHAVHHESGLVLAERHGNSLSRIGKIGPRPKTKRPPNFVGHECRGRKKSTAWTPAIRLTVRKLLLDYEDLLEGMITIILPFSVSPSQFESVRDASQRFFYGHGIAAIAVSETDKPHWHIGVGIPFSKALRGELICYLNRLWLRVFGEPINHKTLRWSRSDAPLECIGRYMQKIEKNGRIVKGFAPWLQCQPYFTSCLPPMQKSVLVLTEAEAKAVLHPFYQVTYDAFSKLNELRNLGD